MVANDREFFASIRRSLQAVLDQQGYDAFARAAVRVLRNADLDHDRGLIATAIAAVADDHEDGGAR